MITIYYPHFDLETKGLIQKQNHVANIILLSLICDQVLILPSHLLYLSNRDLNELSCSLNGFFHSGKIVTSIYKGQSCIKEYYDQKVYFTENPGTKNALLAKSEYILQNLFEEPETIYRDNKKEKELFQFMFNEENCKQAENSKNRKLIHSANVYKNEFYRRSEYKGDYLSIDDVQKMTSDLIDRRLVYKAHHNFFIRNMISAYYYCGSLANSAIPAYNPFFTDISYDVFSKSIPFSSNKIYSPDFLLNILLGLGVISKPDDILLLTSEDIDIIKSNKAWREFRDSYSSLCEYTDNLQKLIDYETDRQRRIDRIKRIVFNIAYGLADLNISSIIGLIIHGFIGLAIGVLLILVNSFFSESKPYRGIKRASTDYIIDKLVQSKRPLYVINNRIAQQIENEIKSSKT